MITWFALILKIQTHLNAGSKSSVQCKNIVRDVDQLGIRLHKSHPFACFDLAVFNPQEVHRVFGLEQKALPDWITHQAGSDYGVKEDKGLGGECGVEIGRFQIKEGWVHDGKVLEVCAKARQTNLRVWNKYDYHIESVWQKSEPATFRKTTVVAAMKWNALLCSLSLPMFWMITVSNLFTMTPLLLLSRKIGPSSREEQLETEKCLMLGGRLALEKDIVIL